MADLDKAIARVIESYKAAVYAKDVQAFISLYHPDVRVFDTWGVWEYTGSAAWRSSVDGWLSSLGAERVIVSFENVKTIVGADLSTVSAVVTYAAVSAAGQELRSMQNRLSWVLRLSGHALRIVHEHTSVPIGFDDTKAILKREIAN